MNHKKILLVNKNYDDFGSSRPMLSLGYLAEALRGAGIERQVMDLNLGYSTRNVLERIRSWAPDVVGVSMFTNGYFQMNDLVRDIKEAFPKQLVVVGGPHVSSTREEVLLRNPRIDYAFTLECERTFPEFCLGKDPALVPGLLYRREDGSIAGNPHDFIKDLDSLAWPRYEDFELDKYIHEMFIITSRGCPYSCMYCSVSLSMGKIVRFRSIGNIMEELSHWYGRGKRIFNFVDDNLTFRRERILKLCDRILGAGMKDLVLRTSNGIRADRTDRPMLEIMRKAGFQSLAIAVEGGNDRMLKILKKGQTLAQVEDCVANACELGFEVSLTFVYGAPGETRADIEDSVRFARKYPVFKVDFYNLVPYPSTELWRWVEEHKAWCVKDPMYMLSHQDKNLRFSDKEGIPFFETPELPLAERQKITEYLRGATLEIQCAGIERVLRRLFGPLAPMLARLCSTKFFNRLIFGNNLLRRWSERIRYLRGR